MRNSDIKPIRKECALPFRILRIWILTDFGSTTARSFLIGFTWIFLRENIECRKKKEISPNLISEKIYQP
jgi:hypothetical protein